MKPVTGGSRAGGLADQVVALGDVRGAAGGLGVRACGGGQVAGKLVQVPAHGVPPVPLADYLAQPVGLAQPGGGRRRRCVCVTERGRNTDASHARSA